ncbi:hypothetical protein BRYFOR_05326 [Marvinbryantia formatexigens DSM 14469]|uniref:Uncharacterized protein n=1 Tax=Marvinbryantia formatexigens DSM 14469 TaxID=478749 RepID=C6L9N6_9FIRM|nr:hypothetical protein [Marvinbryantia formatexigens]EET62975.1 hypothetical protein BRYFOR_05326 [Marvinbryantia formatexigens DSM 14469]UWO23549.1 hypothetical protein NQ534_13950 [Marvinbryantia formatexigens DSM 14469]SDH35902.1 hypothetical protein SAMN05660368_04203 [Marvinbryantia formatexigens]
METAYGMQQGIWDVLSVMFTRGIKQIQLRRKRQKWSVFVMLEEEAGEYRICEKNAQVEIRDAFNSNLVAQYYEGKEKRIILFIPRGWKEKVRICLKKGCVRCFQKKPFECLEIWTRKGAVIYENEEEQL